MVRIHVKLISDSYINFGHVWNSEDCWCVLFGGKSHILQGIVLRQIYT